MKKLKIGVAVAAISIAISCGSVARAGGEHEDRDDHFNHFQLQPETLVLSYSKYVGTASTVTIGQTLPPGCVPITSTSPAYTVACGKAVNDGEYPNLNDAQNVWNNDGPDGSFGVTSPIFLDALTTDGHVIGTLPIPTDQMVTSFSSKSELALNRSTDGKSITFMAYRGGPGFVTAPNQLDVSNSNTPGVVDPSNPVVSNYYRAVGEVDADGHLTVTDGNAYSGNNGRAAIKSHWLYYMTGNDNNGGLSSSELTSTPVGIELINSTGVELVVPGQTPPVPPNINKIGDFEVTQVDYTKADKAGKDNNFRGLTIFDNTLYVTKGSGGNGINTVYQVGTAGTLPTPSNAPGTPPNLKNVPITILPGFPTTLASGTTLAGGTGPVAYPFGIWFANANTLYVCDEGDGTYVSGQANVADAATLATAGVQKWTLTNGTWHMIYVLQDGLNIGVPYGIKNYPTSINPATDGCRNITGSVNHDGTVTIYAVTSTISLNGDPGADPNKLVKVTDVLDATTLPVGDGDHDRDDFVGHFVTIRSAAAGEVLRGITWAPNEREAGDHDDHR